MPNAAGLPLNLHMIAATVAADAMQDEALPQRASLDVARDTAGYT